MEGRDSIGQASALEYPPSPEFLAARRTDYLEVFRKIGNPCFACGTKNPLDRATCCKCNSPLPSRAPLGSQEAAKIVQLGVARRTVLRGRTILALGLMAAEMAAIFLITVMFLPLITTWTEFYAYVIVLAVVFAGIIVLAETSRRLSWGITRSQVVLYNRTSKVRRAYRHWLRENGHLPANSIILDTAPLAHEQEAQNALPDSRVMPTPVSSPILACVNRNSYHIREGFSVGGAVPEHRGTFWRISDDTGKEVLTMVIDNVANKTWVLQKSDAELCRLHRQYWQLFRQKELVGTFVEEASFDDSTGRGRESRIFIDNQGNEVLRMTGGYPTVPTTTLAVLASYGTAKFWASPNPTVPVLQAAAQVSEDALVLHDQTGRAVVRAKKQGPAWSVSIQGAIDGSIPLMSALALISWSPDGVSIGLARRIQSRPDLTPEALAG